MLGLIVVVLCLGASVALARRAMDPKTDIVVDPLGLGLALGAWAVVVLPGVEPLWPTLASWMTGDEADTWPSPHLPFVEALFYDLGRPSLPHLALLHALDALGGTVFGGRLAHLALHAVFTLLVAHGVRQVASRGWTVVAAGLAAGTVLAAGAFGEMRSYATAAVAMAIAAPAAVGSADRPAGVGPWAIAGASLAMLDNPLVLAWIAGLTFGVARTAGHREARRLAIAAAPVAAVAVYLAADAVLYHHQRQPLNAAAFPLGWYVELAAHVVAAALLCAVAWRTPRLRPLAAATGTAVVTITALVVGQLLPPESKHLRHLLAPLVVLGAHAAHTEAPTGWRAAGRATLAGYGAQLWAAGGLGPLGLGALRSPLPRAAAAAVAVLVIGLGGLRQHGLARMEAERRAAFAHWYDRLEASELPVYGSEETRMVFQVVATRHAPVGRQGVLTAPHATPATWGPFSTQEVDCETPRPFLYLRPGGKPDELEGCGCDTVETQPPHPRGVHKGATLLRCDPS